MPKCLEFRRVLFRSREAHRRHHGLAGQDARYDPTDHSGGGPRRDGGLEMGGVRACRRSAPARSDRVEPHPHRTMGPLASAKAAVPTLGLKSLSATSCAPALFSIQTDVTATKQKACNPVRSVLCMRLLSSLAVPEAAAAQAT